MWLVFVFILRALGEAGATPPFQWQFCLMPVKFLGEKAAYVAGWMYFINWAMTGIVDITAVALYMHYWCLAACRSGSLRSLHLPSLAP
ncbi:hypothetical protein ACLB1M_12540 [Escherichia coli]